MTATQLALLKTTDELYQKLAQLHFWQGQGWQPLPPWTLFYLELGVLMANQPIRDGTSSVLALAVASRAYAGPLVAAGYILAQAIVHDDQKEERERHIQWLNNLSPNTPVLVRDNGRRLKGKFQKIIPRSNGDAYYMIRIDSGANTTKGFKPGQIQPLEEKEIKLPNKQTGRARQELAPLVTGLLGEASETFSSRTHLDCVLLGTVADIEQEIKEQRLALARGKRRPLDGVLCDLLRPRRFLRTNSAYRSHVLPAGNKRTEAFSRALTPHMVVFDGSLSYLNQRHAWQAGHIVAILDQTEPQFDPAISQVNQEYYRRSNQEPIGIKLPPVPAGIEAMLYEVRS